MDRRKFVKGCICCATLPLFTSCTMSSRFSDEETDVNDYKIKHIEIHMVEHCNLNCKYCSHFSCIAEKEFYDPEEFRKDIIQLAKVTEGCVSEIQLLGGEPLLHPQIAELAEFTRQQFPLCRLFILTNGVLLNSMKDEFWKTMAKNDIMICPSLYPINLDWKTTLQKGVDFGVKIVNDSTREELKLEDIEKLTIKTFYKLELDEKGRQNISRPCIARENCANLIHGKIYPCFIPSNIRHFNKKFDQHYKVSKQDYIDIYKAENLKQIKTFLSKPAPFCKYCREFSPDYTWKNEKEHFIDEWT